MFCLPVVLSSVANGVVISNVGTGEDQKVETTGSVLFGGSNFAMEVDGELVCGCKRQQ